MFFLYVSVFVAVNVSESVSVSQWTAVHISYKVKLYIFTIISSSFKNVLPHLKYVCI